MDAPASFGPGFSKPVFVTALRMLAGKRLSTAQLRKKLRDRGFAPEVIAEAIAECERKRYLDDRTFAQLFVASALEKKSIGPLRLMRDLLKAGIDGDLAREVIAATDANNEERLDRAIAKLELTRPGERFDRVARRLVTQGFTAPAIARALRRRADSASSIGNLDELS